jgi:hypothetical protein
MELNNLLQVILYVEIKLKLKLRRGGAIIRKVAIFPGNHQKFVISCVEEGSRQYISAEDIFDKLQSTLGMHGNDNGFSLLNIILIQAKLGVMETIKERYCLGHCRMGAAEQLYEKFAPWLIDIDRNHHEERKKIVDALWNVPNERVGPLVQCVVSMGDCELALQLIQLLGNADGIFTKDAVKLFSGFFIRLEYGSRLDNSKSNKIFVQFILGLNEQQRVDVVSALQHVWDSGLLSRLSYIF